jgi:hypothetical protein
VNRNIFKRQHPARMKVPAQRGSARANVVTAVAVTVLATATAAVIAGPARAATAGSPSGGRARQVVFAQTNNTAGNQVVVYDRAEFAVHPGGSLTEIGSVTDGVGAEGIAAS